MKKINCILLSIVMLSLSFAATSCSSDDDNSKYPIKFTHKSFESGDFKIYVGSAEGGKEISTDGMSPKKYWGDWMAEENIIYVITLNDEKSATIASGNRKATYDYKFENKQLFFKDKGEWVRFAYGDENQLKEVASYNYYRKTRVDGSSSGRGEYSIDFNIDNIFEHTSTFNSLNDLTSTGDTVSWHNTYSVYKR